MDKLVYLLPVLGCAAMMGAMMWMMRGNHASHDTAAQQPEAVTRDEIALLRAEIAQLRAQQTAPPAEAEHGTSATRGGTP